MPARREVYADHHATSPLRPEALEAMRPWLTGLAANPSSLHAPGRAARAAVEGARERIAALLGVRPEELVFTSGGTESDALAVCGGARAARDGAP
ncbi:MAG: aminotransferase class V-fold PLP-dependent enzyme, partial [Thermoanaerobaculia bacterium]|nr:aminotransferase class V-fold PLP-dependent enzyme [Thermoanaerobaculia bacterium]